jgi:hypothetical protein
MPQQSVDRFTDLLSFLEDLPAPQSNAIREAFEAAHAPVDGECVIICAAQGVCVTLHLEQDERCDLFDHVADLEGKMLAVGVPFNKDIMMLHAETLLQQFGEEEYDGRENGLAYCICALMHRMSTEVGVEKETVLSRAYVMLAIVSEEQTNFFALSTDDGPLPTTLH